MTEVKDLVTDALRRAFSLGQTYWQQADSEYTSHHRKAYATRAEFQELYERTEETIDTLHAQLAEAQRDSERLDWLDKHCTGASDSERYLPRKIYWGGGSHRDVRAAIDAAKETL